MPGDLVKELQVAARRDMGLKREVNQDNFLIQMPNDNLTSSYALFVVADGVGGNLPKGEIASRTAVDTFVDYFYRHPDSMPLTERTNQALLMAQTAVREQAVTEGVQAIGTTIAGLAITPEGEGLVFNLGDSRVYRLRAKQLELLSTDHVTPSLDANGQPGTKRSSKINSYLGQPRPIKPAIRRIQIHPGDTFLICSDGVWSKYDEPELRAVMQRTDLTAAADEIVKTVHQRGAPDNLTAVLVRWQKARRSLLLPLLLLMLIIGGGAAALLWASNNQPGVIAALATETREATATITASPTATEITRTATPTSTASPTRAASPTDTVTSTRTPSPTRTATASPTVTATHTVTATADVAATQAAAQPPTSSPQPSATINPTLVTLTPSPTFTPSNTPSSTPSPTETNTPTATRTPPPTITPSATFTPTYTLTASRTPTITPSPTASATPIQLEGIGLAGPEISLRDEITFYPGLLPPTSQISGEALPEDTTIRMMIYPRDNAEGLAFVRVLESGAVGWISLADLPATLYIENANGVNVRSGPATSGYEIISGMIAGSKAPILAYADSDNGRWYYVNPPQSRPGWIAAWVDGVIAIGNLRSLREESIPPTLTPGPTRTPTVTAEGTEEIGDPE